MKSSKYAIACVCALLAFLVTIQARSVIQINTNSSVNARTDELLSQLTIERKKNEDLYAELLKYRDEIYVYSEQAIEAGGYSQILAEQVAELSIAAGLTDVKGEGIVVTLTDSKMVNIDGLDENNFLIHDEDLLRVLNELRSAGAEAISVNGERILATSEVVCSGSTVRINDNKYASPYIIEAIGSASDLENALTMRHGVVDILREWGILVEISKKQSLVIEGYTGVINYKYITELE